MPFLTHFLSFLIKINVVCLFHNLLSGGKLINFPFFLHFHPTEPFAGFWMHTNWNPFCTIFFCFPWKPFSLRAVSFSLSSLIRKRILHFEVLIHLHLFMQQTLLLGKQLAPYSHRFDVLWGYGNFLFVS